MAFCNSCGTQLDGSAKFCTKCGVAVPMSGFHAAAAPAAATPPVVAAAPVQAVPAQGGGALKVILIVVAVMIGIGVLGAGVAGFFAWRIANNVRVHSDDKNVRVETPFGTVQSTNNPDEAARHLGVDLYPGARALKSNAASVVGGGMHTVSAEFETNDSPDKVADFYNKKFPKATVSTHGGEQYDIVSMGGKGMVTINIGTEDGMTRIKITNVSGTAFGKSDDSN